MKNIKRISAAILVLVLAIGMCGCKSTPDDGSDYSYYESYITTTVTTEKENNSDDTTSGSKKEPEKVKDLGGRTITFITGWAEPKKGESAFTNEYWAKKLEVEKKYNCKFNFVHGTGDWFNTLTLSILSGSPSADVFCHTGNPYPGIANKLYYDLSKLENIDLSESKWNSAVTEIGTVGKANYTMLSSRFEPPAAILYNKDIFEAQGLPDLYTLQKKGELTLNKFIEIIRKINMPTGKYVAMAYENAFNAHRTFMYSYGGAYVTRKKGTLEFESAINSEAVINGFNVAQSLINDGILHNGRNGSNTVEWDYSRKQFAAGNTAVLIGDTAWTYPFTNGDFEPGIILIPDTKGGTANIFKEATIWCAMPYNVNKVEEVAAVFNEMTDVIFQVNYKVKFQDIVSDDVMELINESSKNQLEGKYIPDYSTTCINLWDDGVGEVLKKVVIGQSTVAQGVQTIEPLINTKINSMLQ